MAEHRVSMLGSSLRRYEDPARSADPRVRAVVAGLRTLEIALPARAHFRAELRAQLVAVAPRLVAEGMAGETMPLPRAAVLDRPRPLPRPREAAVAAPSGWSRALERLRSLPVARPVSIVTAVIAILGMVLGGAVYLSRHALPGDALYGLKRASENVELSLASGPTDKANLLLDFAATRADEVNELLSRSTAMALGGGANASGQISKRTADLINSTLASADSDVRQAAQLLGNAAVRSKSTKPLDILTKWTPGQTARLNNAVARIPAGPLHNRAASSVTLVQQAQTRATNLIHQVTASCLSDGDSDNLGPVPLPACIPSVAPGGPGTPIITPGSSSTGNSSDPSGSTDEPGTGNNGSSTDQGGTGGESSGPGGTSTSKPLITLPPITLPSLPLPSLSSPVNIGTCGVSASLGPIDIGIGPCGVHLHI